MEFLKDRRAILLLGGACLAVVGGLALVVVMAMGQDPSDDAMQAGGTGLVVQAGHDAVQKLDPAQPLRCFTNGRLAGVMTVAECAKKNGVTTGALEVGVEKSAAPAAGNVAVIDAAPPPPEPPIEEASATDGQDGAESDQAGGQPCWSHDGGAWSRTPGATSLNACVRTLFDGQCVRPGAAAYGRWGDRTLRLVQGRVEMSADGHSFRTLTQQTDGCAIPEAE
jgi:hypothetical protein